MNGLGPIENQIPGGQPGRRNAGLTLTELLCVIAIIGILSALYLGAIAKAIVHIKKFLAGF